MPVGVLLLMLLDDRLQVDPDVAVQTFHVKRQTVIQAVHRLRLDGFEIVTIPGPPLWTRWYRLAETNVGEGMRSLVEVGVDVFWAGDNPGENLGITIEGG